MLRRTLPLCLPPLVAVVFALWLWAVLGVPQAYPAHADSLAHPPAIPRISSAGSLTFTISLSQVTSGLTAPVDVTHAGDGSGRLFVVEQTGRIRVVKNGSLLSAPFLNITNIVQCCGERGLLSAAFDPEYETNGTFYVNYTANAAGNVGDTVIARYVVANPAADVATVLTATNLITIDQPQSNHNGGQLQFGPFDHYLYIGMGDGGGSGDSGSGHAPGGNGQSPDTLLGKILRVNVRGMPTYTVPASNPFTQTAGYRPEIWALGLRNPWRFSFDRLTGDMYIGDVGQNCYEEIDFQPGTSQGGENYGWRLMEGFRAFDPADMGNCNQPIVAPVGVTLPITAYGRSLGSTVIGGYVYRGAAYPWLRGVYFFGDFGSGRMWAMEQVSPGNWVSVEKEQIGGSDLTSFGEDEAGELYAVGGASGILYQIVSTAPSDLSLSTKSASTVIADAGNVLTYTIVLRNSGEAIADTVRLTDVLPSGLTYQPGSLTATLGSVDDSAASTLKWNGVPLNTPTITITYIVTVTTSATQAVSNTVTIHPGFAAPFTRSVTILLNGPRIYFPIVFKNR